MQGQKILIIRFSSIGDIVLTTPVIRCLKQQLNAEIHFLTKKSYQQIASSNPHIDKVYLLESKLIDILPALKSEGYDFIVDLHNNLRSGRLKLALKRPSLTFNKINWAKWLMVNLKWNRLPNLHIVERYLAPVLQLGIKNDGQGLDYFIPEDQEVDIGILADQYFSHTVELRDALATGSYIALVIGAAHATKRMPVEKMISICQKINGPVLLLGGPDDQQRGTEIADAAGDHVVNTCGQFKLNQSASLVQQAKLVISHDTGLMHIAAAFQKEIISVWGNTIPDFGMYPFYEAGVNKNTTVQVKDLSCRPCSKIGFESCPKGHFKCMNKIDETIIVGQVQEKLLKEF
ncbi:MAG: glycosyltransferase family 9 protein [Bacteroidota bacterium]